VNFGQNDGLLRVYTLSDSLHVWSYAINVAEVFARMLLRIRGPCQYARHMVERPLPAGWTQAMYICWKAESLLKPERDRTPKGDFQRVFEDQALLG
jgi:hypothetical protein